MKLYLIAGEASGDLHGSNLIKALKASRNDLDLRCWGGDMMEQAGAKLVKHYRDLAFMGFAEVIMNLRTILNNLKFCKEDILQFKPDAIILIDYPGFNLRIAEWAKKNGIKVFYYISPQIWAWKQNRVYKIRECVDRMFVVLPFEKDFYKKFDYDVSFVGHPLLDVIHERKNEEENFRQKHQLGSKPLIALLPGSRKQEIARMLPLMLGMTDQFPEYEFIVAGAPGQEVSFYSAIAGMSNRKIIFGATYDLLNYSKAGLITSGTATLEAGLFKLPQVVCYTGNKISYYIAKRLIKVKYISLVNLILDRKAVTELIQDQLNIANLKTELCLLLKDSNHLQKLNREYEELHQKLGGSGASARTANEMLKILESASVEPPPQT